jgi:hypothetical protein
VGRPSIAIVVTYFGRAPFWLPAFLLSCRKNPDVRWFLYTDFPATPDVPPNVTLKPLTLRAFYEKAAAALGSRIDRKPTLRKGCDFKPTYGVIFADDLRPFDFWAHSDLDIIWGDVRRFMTESLLQDHDIVSSAVSKVAGHCTLFRNTEQTNRAFELIPGVTEELSNRKYRHLDEDVITEHLRATVNATPRGSWPRVFWREDLTVSSGYPKALGDSKKDSLWWRDGRTFDAHGHELMYLHFHKLKPFMKTINFGAGDSPSAFSIDRRGFLA